MQVYTCSRCGVPLESSNYYLRGMTIKCRNCGYSSLPLSSGACIYDRLNIKPEEAPDPLLNELSPESVFSKLALISFFSSVISLWSVELRFFTMASFAGFVIFSIFSGALRLRS